MNCPKTFRKGERISSGNKIDELFREGESLLSYPLRVVFLERTLPGEKVAVLISVPKKRLKRAVDRNRVKRLIRESYRLNKHLLIDFLNETDRPGLDLAFIYIGNETESFRKIESAMIKTFDKLKAKPDEGED